MKDLLLEEMFRYDRWVDLIDKSEQKGIEKTVLRKMSSPQMRSYLMDLIVSDQYNVAPPHIARIPKDNGDFREVYVNEAEDRVVLSLINDSLCELFKDMIHPRSRAYQKGIGCQDTVQMISKELKNGATGYKADLSKFFDSVRIEKIDGVFDEFERRLGFSKETEPVLNLIRRYYHNDVVFDADGNLIEHYGSLKQGCAVSSILANVILYDIDKALSEMDIVYVRYSDDILMLGSDAEKAKAALESMLPEYGLKLNPKKVERITLDRWFSFLGFKMKGDMITLSKNRVKNFQKEIEKRTIKNRNINAEQARRNVIDYLYKGDYNWASSCLGTINVEKDINEMNKFIMDCIRACATNKRKIGGLGSVNDMPDATIIRGVGKNVKANRQKTGYIENYLSVGCLAKDIKISKTVFAAAVRGI